MANQRTGQAKGTKGRRGQLAWRKDDVILQRINLQRTLSARGLTVSQMVTPMNQLMANLGLPEVSIDTLYRDRKYLREIQREEMQRSKEDEETWLIRHVESLTEVKREAWRAFHDTTKTSLNRSAYLNTIRACEETIAKLMGSFPAQRIEATIGRSAEELELFRLAIESEIPDEEMRKRIAIKVLQAPITGNVIEHQPEEPVGFLE